MSSQIKNKHSLSRSGIHALYTFAPFKLFRAQGDSYTFILVPISGNETNQKFQWRSVSVKDSYYVSFGDGMQKKVVQPQELYSQSLSRDYNTGITFRASSQKLKSPHGWDYPPVYLQFDYKSLSQTHFCQLGYVISASQEICPMTSECPYFESVKSDTRKCKYYRGPTAYTSLYNVYPQIKRKFNDPLGGLLFKPLLAMRYGDNPLAIVRFTELGNFFAYIDGIVFAPKPKWITAQPSVFLREGIGFRLANVHALELEFPKASLDEFIRDTLTTNSGIRNWVVLKFLLYMGAHTHENRIREKMGLRAFKQMEKIVTQSITGIEDAEVRSFLSELKDRPIDEEIVEFAEVLVIHGIAHTLKNALTAYYGVKSEDIEYSLDHPKIRILNPPSDKIRVLIFEPVEGGYGYLKNFVSKLEAGDKNVFEFLLKSSSQTFVKSCEEKVAKNLNRLDKDLSIFMGEYAQIISAILNAYGNSFAGTDLFPHINSIRRAIGANVTVPESARPLMDDFLERGAHCWDGCQLCVMLERECIFLPFDQPFLLSERLLRESLNALCKALENPVVNYPLNTKGLMEQFKGISEMATSSIDIVSPWLSPDIIENVVSLQQTKQLFVRFLTKEDKSNEVQIRSIATLKEVSDKHSPYVQSRISPGQLHAKGMVVDGIVAMHGSFNFTNMGLKTNVENATIDFSNEGSKNFLQRFNELFQVSVPL